MIVAALLIITFISMKIIASHATQDNHGIEPLNLDDYTGFISIFDGTLSLWDGDSKYWSVENGYMVGRTTADNPLTQNSFIIWQAGEPGDFELKVEFRISATNSGVQYRSVEVDKWTLKGYQADIDYDRVYVGQLYDERGRAFCALRGQFTQLIPEGRKIIISYLDNEDDLKNKVKVDDWNQYHIIARGNVLIHILNGYLMAQAIDDDVTNRVMKGKIGFQVHVGPPMKIEFRKIYLKDLSPLQEK